MYPHLIVRLDFIKQNTRSVIAACNSSSISVCGVTKGLHSHPEVAQAMIEGGVHQIGDGRLGNLKRLQNGGVKAPLFLTRIPMLSEIEDLVEIAQISLNSEWETINAINDACKVQNRKHKVILMCDLGDLREGFMDLEECFDVALKTEKLSHVELAGVGTNLGCYGAIKPSEENLGQLVSLSNRIADKIGRPLEYVSGGATSSLAILYENKMPRGINHLRIGEGILLARDLPDIWEVPQPGTRQDTVMVQAQIIEKKRKPSHPVGEIFIDAFGDKPVYEDRGWETRAILAMGKQDFAFFDQLIPLDKDVHIIGSSSDHLIVNFPDDSPYKVGDILSFGMYYGPMLFLSGAEHVEKKFVKNSEDIS